MAINDWQTCDPRLSVTRRGLLLGGALGVAGWLSQRSALSQVALHPRGENRNILVVVFLRGGADGLSLLVPHGDDTYYRMRPNLSIPKSSLHNLDGFFGLHPAMAPLVPLYESGTLAALHGVGSDDQTRSHFEAMNTMERGVARRDGPQSGWIARYLSATESKHDSPMRAVAVGSTSPTSLFGASHATTFENLADFRLKAPATAHKSLESLYGRGEDEISSSGRDTFVVLRTLEKVDAAKYKPSHSAAYPDSDLGFGLKQVACLVRADVGLEVACLDKGGWDTHVTQGGQVGWLPVQMGDLSKSLAAFATDMGPEMSRVTVVVMSEFGRRIAENAGLGTDHGHGGAMFTLGGGVKGGRVHARWAGLDKPVGPGDVGVTTDYRDVLAEVLRKRMGLRDSGAVFAGYEPAPVGIFS